MGGRREKGEPHKILQGFDNVFHSLSLSNMYHLITGYVPKDDEQLYMTIRPLLTSKVYHLVTATVTRIGLMLEFTVLIFISCHFHSLPLTHSVLRSSRSGSSEASRSDSYDTLSFGLWFHTNNTAIWNVVTSKSYLPTSFSKLI